MTASDFLRGIFYGLDSGHIALWRLDNKKTTWLSHDDFSKVDPLVETCRKTPKADLYFGLGVHTEPLGPDSRGKQDDVIAIPGLWIDLDFAEGQASKKSKKSYPPKEIAEQCLQQLPIAPSIIVHSGGGFQVYWLFLEPLSTVGKEAWQTGRRLVEGWLALVVEHLRRLGSYDLDPTQDLSRVLRVLGSWNYRAGKDVVLVSGGEDIDSWGRYEPADFEQYVIGHASVTVPKVEYQPGELSLDENASPLADKLDALRTNSPEFNRVWEHRKTFPSCSEYELSIASYAAQALWSDQEIANLLIYHRRRWEPGKLSKLTDRRDYIEGVLRKIRSGDSREAAIQSLNGLKQDDTEASAGDERSAILDRLSHVFGVRVSAWLQFGREKPIYTLVLANGRQIKIGGVAEVIASSKAIATAIYAETGHCMEHVSKKAWHGVCEGLARIVTVMDATDASDVSACRNAIGSYLVKKDVRDAAQKDAACCEGLPFVQDGNLYICVDPFRKWANFHSADKWDKRELLNAMRLIGFRQHTVGFEGSHGKRTTKSYWTIGVEEFPDSIPAKNRTQ